MLIFFFNKVVSTKTLRNLRPTTVGRRN